MGMRLLIPHWQTLDGAALVITSLAMVATLRFKFGMLPTLAASAALGMLSQFLF